MSQLDYQRLYENYALEIPPGCKREKERDTEKDRRERERVKKINPAARKAKAGSEKSASSWRTERAVR